MVFDPTRNRGDPAPAPVTPAALDKPRLTFPRTIGIEGLPHDGGYACTSKVPGAGPLVMDWYRCGKVVGHGVPRFTAAGAVNLRLERVQ